MTNISIGKYVPYNSFLHRLDPRNKLVFVIMIMVAIFMGYSTWSTTFFMGGLLLILIVILMLISHISLIDLFNSLKVLWIMVIFLLIINVLIPKGGYTWVCLNINGYIIYWESILQSAKIILRLVLMISLTLILTSTTKPLELTYALEWFMTPLKVIKFPAHEIAMTISIALRFIPTLLDETDRIMKAQASRGVDFEKGKLTSKVRAIIALIVPLFISAFQRSEELANAMEARGYNPRGKRTRYRNLSWNWVTDTLSFIILNGISIYVIVLSATNFDFLNFLFGMVTL